MSESVNLNQEFIKKSKIKEEMDIAICEGYVEQLRALVTEVGNLGISVEFKEGVWILGNKKEEN